MECTSILEPGGQSYLLVTGVYQDPLAHCDSVFIRQNGTRQYFCLNYNARRNAPTEVENKTPNIRIQYPTLEYNTQRSII